MTDSTGIGPQLQKLRKEKKLTQAALADKSGVSIDLISKLERGVRASTTLATAIALTDALDVDLAELVGKRPRLDGGDDVSVLALRDVILSPDLLPGIPAAAGEAPALPAVQAAVRQAWAGYWSGTLSALTAGIPGLIGQARMAASQYGPRAAQPLTQAYQLAACLLVHLGKDDLATMAAERAVTAAKGGDDELLWATVNGTYAWCIHHSGRLDAAERHALAVAEQIQPDFLRARLPHLTVWGGLVLTGLASAAAAERAGEVADYIGLARTGAGRMDRDRHDYQTNFGPTQVAMQATHAYTMLHAPAKALKAARGVDRADLHGISWGRHLIDVAQSQLYAGDTAAAQATAGDAADVSPEWFRHQGPARAIVGELLVESRRLSPRLRQLADITGADA